MKIVLLLISCLVFTSGNWAQEIVTRSYNPKTLLKDGGRPTGGFLAIQPKMTFLADQEALMLGGQLAMVHGHQFNIGIAGYALLSDVDVQGYYYTNLPVYLMPTGVLEFAYAGLLLEPVFFNKSVVHFTAPVIIGPGIASIRNTRIWESDSYNTFTDVVGVVEPGLNMELNLTRMIRFNFGASYRFVFDSDLPRYNNKSLSHVAIMAGFKIGWY